MKIPRSSLRLLSGLVLAIGGADLAQGHEDGISAHPHSNWSMGPTDAAPDWFFAQAEPKRPSAAPSNRPAQATPFAAFNPKVTVHWDEQFLYIEHNGIPNHGMMKGISAWQQQVPLPQNYSGSNAWQIPLTPIPSREPASIKGRFLRGAIAVAVNGIPIFNPQNNRGEISAEIGELDEWGGHCGRADDYHYHAAPLFLQSIVGKNQPIAFALDGYPIFGLTEPNGAAPSSLDSLNGHSTPSLGYHYHASNKYPYVNGGFHGEVREHEGQVDPQPRAQSIRKDLPPLRGAKITNFTVSPDEKNFALQYTVGTKSGSVSYDRTGDGAWRFQFVNADGSKSEATYGPSQDRAPQRPNSSLGGNREEGLRGGPDRNSPDRLNPPLESASSGTEAYLKPSRTFVLKSPGVKADGVLPVEYTGDGNSSTLPLQWSGSPAGTKSYALLMTHLDPEGKMKWYWTLYNIPPNVQSLAKNTKGVGMVGNNSVNDQIGYAPPHSKGPGTKTYTLTLYALSSPAQISVQASAVNRQILLAAIKDRILATAQLDVNYTRTGESKETSAGEPSRPKRDDRPADPPSAPKEADPQRKPWLQMHGAELDADQNGSITLSELTHDFSRAFARYNSNQDLLITKGELETAGEIREGSAFAGLIHRHFHELDENADGSLSFDELRAAAQSIFTAADLDHDGAVGLAEWQSAPNTPLPIRSNGPNPPRPAPGTGNPTPPRKP